MTQPSCTVLSPGGVTAGAFFVGLAGMSPRRFPPPWTFEDNGACFIARDHNGQALAYFYYEEDLGRRSTAKLLTRDEARRLATNFCNLPNLLTLRTEE